MSLRDQLLAKGLVDRKKARQTERALKKQRKREQGVRRSKREEQAEAEALARAEQERQQAEHLEQHRARQAVRDMHERALRVHNLIAGNRVRPGRGQRFWHRGLKSSALHRTEVSSGVAWQLRCGQAGIVALDHGTHVQYLVLPVRPVRVLLELQPDVVVFFVDDTDGISDPEEAFYEAGSEPDLRPRRATPADLERFREGSEPGR